MLSSRFKSKSVPISFSDFTKTAFNNIRNNRLVLCSPFSSITTNLAIEEGLIRAIPYTRSQRLLFLYMNDGGPDACVVVGRHQNVWSEVNVPRCRENKVNVQRRHSGGGTVYHDRGTLCMSFLTHKETYFPKTNMKWLDAALRRAGLLDAASHRTTIGERRDDLFVNGMKLSGSAMRLALRAAYHHCTLLVDSDLASVSSMLHPDLAKKPEFIRSRASGSVRSKVANLSDITSFNSGNISAEQVAEILAQDFVSEEKSGKDFRQLSSKNKQEILSPNINDCGNDCIFMLDDSLEALLANVVPEGGVEKELSIRALHDSLASRSFTFGSTPKFGFVQEFCVKDVCSSTVDVDVEKGVVNKVNGVTATTWTSSDAADVDSFMKTLHIDRDSFDLENPTEVKEALQSFIEETLKSGLFEVNLYEENRFSAIRERVLESALYCYDRFLVDRGVIAKKIDDNNNGEDDAEKFKKEFCCKIVDQLLEKLLAWI